MMEVDDIGEIPTQTLEHFAELSTIEQMIDDLKNEHGPNFEKTYEMYSNILSRYQEQPHLLNKHLPGLVEKLLAIIRAKDVPTTLYHAAFKCLYQICKVRQFKVFVKFLQHEITDLDFVLNALEEQNAMSSATWETRYMLLVCLSILVLNPFELARFDAIVNADHQPLSKMERIFNICKLNTNSNDTCSQVAAFLTAKFLIRIDIKDKYLTEYFDWVIGAGDKVRFGNLEAISNILKHGKREDHLIHAPKLHAWLLSWDINESGNEFLKHKYLVKIIQRLGLVFLKPRLASWRYQRGSRSLMAKLANKKTLNPLEPNEAWHGASLAIAELAKRGLLLPYRLETLVPLLLQALVYDELKGYMSVGQHIRDAACYMCWAFARAYEPDVLKQFVNKIAAGLLITTVFDREINCRRAASAAFQESVGRLRSFPYGIDILTKADFYSVGLRTQLFLEVSDYIAQYNDYSFPLIDHLAERKVNHWDTAIRELTAKTLHKLAAREPDYIATNVLPKLFEMTSSSDINQRHGTVLAIGEIVAKLRQLENENGKIYIDESLTGRLNGLVATFQRRDQFKGISGEMMFQCCSDFICNCSSAKIAVTPECLNSWQLVIDSSITKNSLPIRDSAVSALSELSNAYYNRSDRIESNGRLLHAYLTGLREDSWEYVRMGYASAIGALPDFILKLDLADVISALITHSLTPADQKTFLKIDVPNSSAVIHWSEARRDCVKALINVVQSVGFDSITNLELVGIGNALSKVFDCFLLAMHEYTIDNRGDIGAWVREAAMNALFKLVVAVPREFLTENKVHAVLGGLLQQAVERIDRTRALAGKLFCKIIYNEPAIPFIKHHEFVKTIFPEDYSNILWLHAAHTFPLFCSLLELPEYTDRLMIGLIASIGQLTESLIKYSSTSLIDFLRSHSEHRTRICDVIVDIFKKNLLNERITCALLNFLNILIGSGVIDDILLDSSSQFSFEIYRLTKLEIKGHKKLYKLISSINVFCHLIQVPELSSKILSTLTIFLGLPHVHVRKSTAAKLYEALILHAEACNIPEDNLEDIMNCLSETDWGQNITEIRKIRNNLCSMMNIKPPVTAANLS